MHYVFKLYVAGHGRNSTSSINSLQRLLDRELKQRDELKIVDVLEDPRLSEERGNQSSRVQPRRSQERLFAIRPNN